MDTLILVPAGSGVKVKVKVKASRKDAARTLAPEVDEIKDEMVIVKKNLKETKKKLF